jgi:hypothetical protein
MACVTPTSQHTDTTRQPSSSNEGGCGRRVILEARRDLLLRLVVASEAVDTGLDENEAELRVLVLAVDLKVLADGDGLLDEVPEVLRNRGCETWKIRRSTS